VGHEEIQGVQVVSNKKWAGDEFVLKCACPVREIGRTSSHSLFSVFRGEVNMYTLLMGSV
jgi:hypothetical protein